MRQTRQQQHHLLGLPVTLPAGHKPQGLFVLAEGRFDHGAAVVGIGEGHGLVIGQGRHQYRILIAALLLGGTDHPLACGPAEAMGSQHGRRSRDQDSRWAATHQWSGVTSAPVHCD